MRVGGGGDMEEYAGVEAITIKAGVPVVAGHVNSFLPVVLNTTNGTISVIVMINHERKISLVYIVSSSTCLLYNIIFYFRV